MIALPGDSQAANLMQQQMAQQMMITQFHQLISSSVMANLVSNLDNDINIEHKAKLSVNAATALCKQYWPNFKMNVKSKQEEPKDGSCSK